MNDRQIQCFLETAKMLSFSKAANLLCLPQPAVSRYISVLESELGTELFVRKNTRNIQLSEAGQKYFNFFQRYETEFNILHTQMISSPEGPDIDFGYVSGWRLSSFLPNAISSCKKQVPDLRVDIKCMEFDSLLQSLIDKKLDAILTISDYPRYFPGLIQKKVTAIKRYIFYSNECFPEDRFRSPEDFSGVDFLLLNGLHMRQMMTELEGIFRNYRFIPKFHTVDNVETIVANVENGQGVVLLDQWWESMFSNPIISYMELDSKHEISYVWRMGDDNPAIRLLHDALVDQFSS